VSDCCLTPTQQFFSFSMTRTRVIFNEMTHFGAYPKPRHGFPTPYVVVFLYSFILGEMWFGRFVDIDETVDHHCLKME
jgi:hypothetical protein